MQLGCSLGACGALPTSNFLVYFSEGTGQSTRAPIGKHRFQPGIVVSHVAVAFEERKIIKFVPSCCQKK